MNWDEHGQALESAAAALKQNRFGKAVRDYSRSIDLLMNDLKKSRAAANGVSVIGN